MEIVAAAMLLFTLITVSADRDSLGAEDSPVAEYAYPADAVARADGSGYAPRRPACGPGIVYRNLSVPAQQAVYWNADGERCDPEGSP